MGLSITGSDSLSERASMMRESLQKSQIITENVVSILGSFDYRPSALETAMRPTQIRTISIRKAHENIDKTLKAADVILTQFDLSRQAETKILRGPHEDWENYLDAIDQLRSNIHFFSTKRPFKGSDVVLSHANGLLTKALSKLEDEFKQLLSSYSKPIKHECLFDGLPNSSDHLQDLLATRVNLMARDLHITIPNTTMVTQKLLFTHLLLLYLQGFYP